MKDKLVKMRNHVNWYNVILHLEDPILFAHLNKLRCVSKVWSLNRLSYFTLIHFYDKRVLDYYRATRDLGCFNLDFDFVKGRFVIN